MASADDGIIYSSLTDRYASGSARMATRGMWHQFGHIPDANTGVFLQIESIPRVYLTGAVGTDTKMESLMDLVGFRADPAKLGELADAKVIREAVVAVPFLQMNGETKLFSLPRKDIMHAQIGITKERVGKTIVDMVEKMSRYVFPPSMDFLSYESVRPFAMYIFEFEHILDKQDLSYIWQNLIPDIGLEHQEAESSIAHELLSHELLGDGAKVSVTEDGTKLDESSKNSNFNSNVRWMVFKVKQKAEVDYYKQVVGKVEGRVFRRGDEQGSPSFIGAKSKINYNWPYDFFSLVELVKLDVEVEFSQIERDDTTRARRLQPVASNANLDIDFSNPLSSLGEPDK